MNWLLVEVSDVWQQCARSCGVLFAVTLVRDVAGATHRNAQEGVELDRLMRERTSSPSEAFSFKSSPSIVTTLSTQPSASSTHRSNSSLLTCCFPSWYLLAVASRVLRLRYLVEYGPNSAQGCFYCVFLRRDRLVDILQCCHCDQMFM